MKIKFDSVAWLISLIACAIIFYAAYWSGELARKVPLSTPIIAFSACLISILIIYFPLLKNIPRQTKIIIVCGALILGAYTNIVFVSDDFHTEPLICTLFAKGYIKQMDVDEESDEGNEYTVTKFYFIPASKNDETIKNLVDLCLIEIAICSILFPYFLLRYKLNFSFK